MGWLYSYTDTTKEQAVKTVLNDFKNSIIEYSVRGNRIWALCKSRDDMKFVALFLLQKSDGNYGYKDMDESCGPYYWDCPLKYLDKADPPINQTAKEWREQVRLAAVEKKNKVSILPGDQIYLGEGFAERYRGEYLVTANLGRKGYEIVCKKSSMKCRLPCRQVKNVKFVPTFVC